MSADSEQQIRDSLGGVLDAITPSSPPVGPVIRRGRGRRNRRRAGLAGGLAVLAGLGIVLPGALRHATEPAARPHYRITVDPIGRNAPAGLIGRGAIDGKSWRVVMSKEGGDYDATFPGTFGQMPLTQFSTPKDQPADLSYASTGSLTALYGTVARDVSVLTVRLPGEPVLRLHPVAWRGLRWVAVVIPTSLPVANIAAYSSHGELGHSVPFRDTVVTWLRPGQAGRSRLTVQLGSGTVDGHPWSATAHAGPWGLCLVTQTDPGDVASDCVAATAPLVSRGQLVAPVSCGPASDNQSIFGISVAALSVRLLRLYLSDGSTVTVHPAAVGRFRIFAYVAGHGQRFTGWTAYGAAGQQLGSGTGTALTTACHGG